MEETDMMEAPKIRRAKENRRKIYETMKAHPTAMREELSEITGMSYSSVSNAIEFFKQNGLILLEKKWTFLKE